ncbi:MAG: transposase [Arhodomonas sp.]|nr:transposase [Arhodomonas sp.]
MTFDGFHVIQLANEAVDEVRRAEVRTEPVLKHTRWVWLKDGWRWTKRQLNDFHNLSRTQLKTARAWRLKDALRELYAQAPPREIAAAELRRWYSWARRCRLEPFKRLALTIKAHWEGILNAFDSRLQQRRRRGHQRAHPGRQGPSPRLPHRAQPDHDDLSHRRQTHPNCPRSPYTTTSEAATA